MAAVPIHSVLRRQFQSCLSLVIRSLSLIGLLMDYGNDIRFTSPGGHPYLPTARYENGLWSDMCASTTDYPHHLLFPRPTLAYGVSDGAPDRILRSNG
ncbi:hypothetical protein ABZX51_012195 [Aspergillus tubingensis]